MATVTVRINGMEYNLKGKEDEKYLHHLASYVEDKLKEILRKNTKLSVSAASILTAINLADESFKDKKKLTELLETHEILKRANKSVQEELEGIQKKHNIAITTKDTQLAKVMEDVKKGNNAIKALNTFKIESQKTLESLKIESEKKLMSLKAESAQKLESLKIESEKKLEDLKVESAKKLQDFKIESEKKLELEKIESKEFLKSLKTEYEIEVNSLKDKYKKNLEDSKVEVLDLKTKFEDVVKVKEVIESEKNRLEETNAILILEKQRLEKDKLELQEELNNEMQSSSAVESLEEEIEKLKEQLGLLEAKNEKITN
ncbi:MAG: cell division protein ZapA, partial [Sarcina sp.]